MLIKSRCQHCNSVADDVETRLEPYGPSIDDEYMKVELCNLCAGTAGAISMKEYEK